MQQNDSSKKLLIGLGVVFVVGLWLILSMAGNLSQRGLGLSASSAPIKLPEAHTLGKVLPAEPAPVPTARKRRFGNLLRQKAPEPVVSKQSSGRSKRSSSLMPSAEVMEQIIQEEDSIIY